MALGGGTFTAQNKVLPGSYINVVSRLTASAALSDRGYVAAALQLGYAPEGLFTITADDLYTRSRSLLGHEYGADELRNLREILKNAHTVYCYNVLAGGAKASNTYATAKYNGEAGNQIKIRIEADVDDSNSLIVSTLFNNDVVDEQKIAKVSGSSTADNGLKDNDYVVFKKTAVPAVTAATALSGGTDGTYSGGQISSAFTAFESCTFNTLVVEGASTDDEAAANYAERQREKYGKKFQAVISDIGKASAVDHEGVVKVPNKALNVSDLTGQLKFWTAGALAGCPINRSLTNTVYDGEYEVDVNYSQAELESLIENGFFAFHRVGDDVRVLLDRNSLVTYTEDKGELFNDNQVIRVADQIANDIAVIFNTKYIGAVQNNATGRALFKADIIQHHNQLQDMNAIEGFTADSVTIEAGTEKGAVVVTDAVTVVGTMTKLYMTVYVS